MDTPGNSASGFHGSYGREDFQGTVLTRLNTCILAFTSSLLEAKVSHSEWRFESAALAIDKDDAEEWRVLLPFDLSQFYHAA